MSNPTRKSELVLVLGFLAVIAGVPVIQTCIELARHERVQATDVFRYRPTAKNLRQYEHTLEEKSWFQQHLRPLMQRFLFAALHDTGAKGVLGRDRWLFYRPDLRYLVEPDRPEADTSDSKWVQPPSESTHRGSVEKAILRFRDQLKERGITLVVMPVPGKPSVYPDQVTRRAVGKERQFLSPTLDLLDSLQRQGVATVDLFAAFQAARQAGTLVGRALRARRSIKTSLARRARRARPTRGFSKRAPVRSTWRETRTGHRWERRSPRKPWRPKLGELNLAPRNAARSSAPSASPLRVGATSSI